jgi:hypothetical protein
MLSTSQLRNAWAPACTGPFNRVSLHGEGVISIRGGTEHAWLALNACLVKWDYRTRRIDTGAYNCRKITGGTGYSLHAYGIAADLNWQSNPYGPTLVTDMPRPMVDAILRLRTRNGQQVFRWGGDYRTNKDAMHFEIVCDRHDLSTGIDPTTLPTQPAKPTPEPPKDVLDMTPEELRKIVREEVGRAIGWTRAVAEDPKLADTSPESKRLADRAGHLNPERKG